MSKSMFEIGLEKDLSNPEFRKEYESAKKSIEIIDSLINSLDAAREAAGFNKAELARKIGANPTIIRRLFSSGNHNPTLSTVAQIASVLELEVVVRPVPKTRPVKPAKQRNSSRIKVAVNA